MVGIESKQSALLDISIYILFLFVTTIITLSSREIGMFYFNRSLERLFLQRTTYNHHHLELTYEDLVTTGDWWSFVETTFLESIYQFELGNFSNTLAAGSNVLLGVPRLRQIRIKKEPCRVDHVFENEFNECYGDYATNKEDVDGFLGTQHSTQSDIGTYTVWGSIARYKGAGYVEELTFDKEQSKEILTRLKDAVWIDRATRVVLIEFALFNANVNLFCNAKLLAEVPATGGFHTSSHLQSLKFSPLWNEGGLFIPLCSAVFFGLILYYTLVVAREILAIGCLSFSSSLFNILDVVILLIAHLSAAYVIWHILFLRAMMDNYSNAPKKHTSLDVICYWNLFFIDAMGICVFLAWIQILKYIKFNKTMVQFSTTLRRCAKDLLGFTVMFTIVFCAYALLSVVVFGTVNSEYYRFSSAILSLMRTVLGDFDYAQLEAANRVLGPIFFISFILVVFFILMNMFLAIINDTYTDVKSEKVHSQEHPLEEDIKMLLTKCKDMIKSLLCRRETVGVNEEKERESENSRRPLEPESKPQSISTQQTRDLPEQQPKTIQELLDSLFEVVSSNNDNVEDPLVERVTLLETKMDQLVAHLDQILNKVSPNGSKPSGRSL